MLVRRPLPFAKKNCQFANDFLDLSLTLTDAGFHSEEFDVACKKSDACISSLLQNMQIAYLKKLINMLLMNIQIRMQGYTHFIPRYWVLYQLSKKIDNL